MKKEEKENIIKEWEKRLRIKGQKIHIRKNNYIRKLEEWDGELGREKEKIYI